MRKRRQESADENVKGIGPGFIEAGAELFDAVLFF